MQRFIAFIQLVTILTVLWLAVWLISAALLPPAILRPYFSRLFAERVGEFTAGRILLANLAPFLGVQFMNLFRVGRRSGGLYVLPLYWMTYGVLLGTNSFVFADPPVTFSLSVLWTRVGYTELLAYTAGYEATRNWAVWQQASLWARPKRLASRWKTQASDWVYWGLGLLLLGLAALREVQ